MVAATKTLTFVLLSDFVKSKKNHFYSFEIVLFSDRPDCAGAAENFWNEQCNKVGADCEKPRWSTHQWLQSVQEQKTWQVFHLCRHNLEIWAWSYFGKANEGRLEYWIFLFQGRGVSLLRRVPLHPKWQYWHWLSGRLKKICGNIYIDFFSHCRDQSTTTIWSGIKKTVGFLINDQHCHPGFQVDEILPFKPDSHRGRG